MLGAPSLSTRRGATESGSSNRRVHREASLSVSRGFARMPAVRNAP